MTLRDAMDRLFAESSVDPAHLLSVGRSGRAMPLEVCETPESVVVKALLPGISPDSLDVQISSSSGVSTWPAST